MNCLVLDDEEQSIRHLIDNNIKKIPYLNLVGAFTNPEEALIFLQTYTVELIFLDIEMPNFSIDGIDFMKIMKPDQRYILTTAHPQYALESYEYNVVDYLRKPFSFDRFAKAVQKAQQLIQASVQEAPPKTEDYMFVKEKGNYQRVFFDDICSIKADGNYANIYRTSDVVSTKNTLKYIEEQLPASKFFRVHKSYIVSLGKIESIEKDQIGITRTEETQKIPLSAHYKKEFLQLVENKRILKGE